MDNVSSRRTIVKWSLQNRQCPQIVSRVVAIAGMHFKSTWTQVVLERYLLVEPGGLGWLRWQGTGRWEFRLALGCI